MMSDSRVIDIQVEMVKCRKGTAHHLDNLRLIADICRDIQRAHAVAFDLAEQLVVLHHVGNGNMRAFSGERQRDSASDSAAAPCDECCLPAESCIHDDVNPTAPA